VLASSVSIFPNFSKVEACGSAQDLAYRWGERHHVDNVRAPRYSRHGKQRTYSPAGRTENCAVYDEAVSHVLELSSGPWQSHAYKQSQEIERRRTTR
jgi:hypothetical protein